MVRLFTLRCTEKQMALMLNHPDSPYIRCIGFLYLRYATEPSALYSWYDPYLYDEQPVRVSPNPASPEITIGEYARRLLMEMDYHGTLLPRLPVTIERDVKVKLLQVEKIEARALGHLNNFQFMEYCQKVGCQLRALYGDEENPTTWYDCVVDRVIKRDDETGMELTRPKFVVTFPEYGNTEIVTLGEIDIRANESSSRFQEHDGYSDWNKNRSSDRRATSDYYRESERYSRQRSNYDRGYNQDRRDYDRRGHRDGRGYASENKDRNKNSTRQNDRNERWERDRFEYSNRSRDDDRRRSRSRSREREDSLDHGPTSSAGRVTDEKELMEEVLRREREKSTASGKAYARQPKTFKNSLSAKMDGGGASEKGNWRGHDREHTRKRDHGKGNTESNSADSKSVEDPSEKVKSPEEIAAAEEKKRKLLAKYG